jgi:hypothetical protein
MGGLSFLSPLFLAGALAVAIPIVLHLFRRRNDPVVPFSALRFVQQLPIEQARRRRLQDLLLLALRVAALALLAASFARPYLAVPASSAEAGVTVVAVDASGSMGDTPRAARARALAEAAVTDAPAGDLVSVVRFAGRADTLIEPTLDRAAARQVIGRVRPTAAPTRYHAALARALEIIGTRPGRIVLVTDLQASGWNANEAVGVPARVSLSVQDVGPMPPNAGITAVDRTPDGIRVALTSTGPARDVGVALTLDGALVGRTRAALPADGGAEVAFKGVSATRGALVARLERADGVPADDERWLVLDPRPRATAVIVASPGAGLGDAVYVRRALEAAEPPRGWQVEVRAADRVRAPSDLPAAVAVIVGTAGIDRRGAEALRQFVEQGGGLLVAAGPGVNLELLAAGFGDSFPRVRVGPPAEVPHSLVPTDTRHPVFRLFASDAGAFDQARFSRVAQVATTAPATVIARFDSGGPALVDQVIGRGRLCVFASDLSNRWNDLVLQPAFVPWIVETAAWLAGSQTAPAAVMAGDGSSPDTDVPGVIDWRKPGAAAGAAVTRVAVNPSLAEFDPRRRDEAAFLAEVPRDDRDLAGRPAQAQRQEDQQRWWQYGLGLMLVGLIVESAIGRRG